MANYRIVPSAIPLLFELGEAADTEAAVTRVAARTGVPEEQLRGYVDGLIAGGVLEPADANQTRYAPGQFATMLGQRSMLADEFRCYGFEEAIRRVVKPGDVVVDVGSGSGILSMFAARAGAGHVYVLEVADIALDSRKVIEASGLSDKITVVQGDAADFKGVAQADVILGEWIGTPWMDEWHHMEAFARVRDRLLKPGGRVIPQRLEVLAAPVDGGSLHRVSGLSLFTDSLYGFDFSDVAARLPNPRPFIRAQMPASSIAAKPALYQTVDCLRDDSSVYDHEATLTFDVSIDRQFNGFVVGFDLHLGADVRLLVMPHAAPTSWGQAYFPMPAHGVRRGDRISAKIRSARDVEDKRRVASYHFDVAIQRGGSTVYSDSCEFGPALANPTML